VKAPMAAPIFNWTGFYVGADAGYLWSRARVSYPGFAQYSDPDPDAVIAGGHFGYRHQLPSNLVLGIEGDIWGAFDGEDDAIVQVQNFNRAVLDLRAGASVRASVGLAVDRWLGYVTGGGAYISLKGCESASSGGPCFGFSDFKDGRWGWTAGGGVAYAFAPNLIGRIEYLFADYGAADYSTVGVFAGLTRVDLKTHTVRVGVSWTFATGKGAVVARY
jgi:outer membrane immunogenic protein